MNSSGQGSSGRRAATSTPPTSMPLVIGAVLSSESPDQQRVAQQSVHFSLSLKLAGFGAPERHGKDLRQVYRAYLNATDSLARAIEAVGPPAERTINTLLKKVPDSTISLPMHELSYLYQLVSIIICKKPEDYAKFQDHFDTVFGELKSYGSSAHIRAFWDMWPDNYVLNRLQKVLTDGNTSGMRAIDLDKMKQNAQIAFLKHLTTRLQKPKRL